MESILSGGEDFLLPGLSYDLAGDQASYVVGRRQSQLSSNVLTAGPNDVRQVSFYVADGGGGGGGFFRPQQSLLSVDCSEFSRYKCDATT